jgi:hypothetical protein
LGKKIVRPTWQKNVVMVNHWQNKIGLIFVIGSTPNRENPKPNLIYHARVVPTLGEKSSFANSALETLAMIGIVTGCTSNNFWETILDNVVKATFGQILFGQCVLARKIGSK